MAYSAVSGGEEAIEASIQLLDYYRAAQIKILNWSRLLKNSVC